MKLDEVARVRIAAYEMCGCDVCQAGIKRVVMEQRIQNLPQYITYDKPNDLADAMALTFVPFTMKKEISSMNVLVKTDKPENMAVKLLVDKLKVEQASLTSHQSNIDYHKKQLKDFNSKKSATNKNIKELSDALKKLGYKEIK